MTLTQVFVRTAKAAYKELSAPESLEVYAQVGGAIRSQAITTAIFSTLVLIDMVPKAVGAAQILADVGIGLYHWSLDQFSRPEISIAALEGKDYDLLTGSADTVPVIEDHDDWEQDDLFWFEPMDHEQFTLSTVEGFTALPPATLEYYLPRVSGSSLQDQEEVTEQPVLSAVEASRGVPEQPTKVGIRELRQMVKSAGIKGYSRMTKVQCLAALGLSAVEALAL